MLKDVDSNEATICPYCSQKFLLDVKVMTILKKGNISRENAIGYIQIIKCEECKNCFPYFSNTCKDSKEFNIQLDWIQKLVKDRHKIILRGGAQTGFLFMSGLLLLKRWKDRELNN